MCLPVTLVSQSLTAIVLPSSYLYINEERAGRKFHLNIHAHPWLHKPADTKENSASAIPRVKVTLLEWISKVQMVIEREDEKMYVLILLRTSRVRNEENKCNVK